jgi:hypothetical protein
MYGNRLRLLNAQRLPEIITLTSSLASSLSFFRNQSLYLKKGYAGFDEEEEANKNRPRHQNPKKTGSTTTATTTPEGCSRHMVCAVHNSLRLF